MHNNIDHLLPEYLRQIEIEKHPPPASKDETELPFNKLDPLVFQRFCCEFLYGEFSQLDNSDKVVSIEPIGDPGQNQYGADIFVKKPGKTGEIYELYEVKRVERFSKSDYLEAVNRFLSNYEKWKFKPTRFYVITASNLKAEDIAEWQGIAQKLSSFDVEYEFITPATLNRNVRKFPALVYQFFDIAWVEKLFGKKARWHFEQYGIHNFEESPAWLKYDKPIEEEIGDSFIIQNDHVKINGHLPTLRSNSASCLVELRNPRFSYILLTLKHIQLVETYFEGHYTPIESKQRNFLLPYDEGYFCDIGNCRVKISSTEANAVCHAFDSFWDMYSHRVEAIEKAWQSTQFEILPGLDQDVPLLTIKRSLWAILLEFSHAHDVYGAEGGWAIFDSLPNWLRIYTRERTERFDPGFHAVIKPTSADNWRMNFRANDDEVLLIWEPPGEWNLGPNNEIGPRYYWDAETTHNWLTQELIPYALFWKEKIANSHVPTLAKRLLNERDFAAFSKKLKLDDYMWSRKSRDITDITKVVDIKTLENMASFLQCSYNGNHSDSVYLTADEYRNLYKALHKVLSCTNFDGDEGGSRYVLSKLDHLGAKSFDELLDAVRIHSLNSSDPCNNAFHIDLTLRSLSVCLRDFRSSLNNIEVREVATLLAPVLRNVLRMELLERQKKRLLPQY